jgi:hypothetical protein
MEGAEVDENELNRVLEDIAAIREVALDFRDAAAMQSALFDELHGLNVEAQILFKADTPIDREMMLVRLMQIDVLTKGVFESAKATCEGVALLHEQQADKKERGEMQ